MGKGLKALRAIFVSEVDVPTEHRDAIGAARRRIFHANAPFAAIHALLNAVVLTVSFWAEPTMPLVFVWCYTAAVLVFIRIREAKRSGQGQSSSAEDDRIVRYTILSGVVWGAIIAALMASTDAGHGMILGILTAAILCVGALLHSSFPLASLGYSLAVGAGACLGMTLGGHSWAGSAMLLVVGCIMALQRFAAASDANFVRRHLDAAALSEAKETMGILLKDFEAHSADWLWRIDAHGRLGQASQRFVDATGLSADILEGGSLLALFAPESAQQLDVLLKERKPFNDEILRVQIGTREGWWSISGHPTTDGGLARRRLRHHPLARCRSQDRLRHRV